VVAVLGVLLSQTLPGLVGLQVFLVQFHLPVVGVEVVRYLLV